MTKTETYKGWLDVEKKLPEFVKACNQQNADTILLCNSAFSDDESLLLGEAIKYAGKKNKVVTVIPGQP